MGASVRHELHERRLLRVRLARRPGCSAVVDPCGCGMRYGLFE
jgi:hypothetical protein